MTSERKHSGRVGFASWRSLLRTSLRSLSRRRWLSILCIVGIALGVAVVVSIDLANESARRTFTLATESVAGRATHQIVGGPLGVDEEVYLRLRVELGEQYVAPLVSGYVQVEDQGGQPLRILGIDPFADAPFRSYLQTAGDLPDKTEDELLIHRTGFQKLF